MRVIKHGITHKDFEKDDSIWMGVCTRCACVFQLDEHDAFPWVQGSKYFEYCPECRTQTEVTSK